MLRNYLQITWRNLLKQKLNSFIKIGGFAIGITACLAIALYIKDELSFDKHYIDGNRIFRLVASYDAPGGSRKWVTLQAPIKQVLESDFPEVEIAGRVTVFEFANAGDNQIRPIDQIQSTYEDGFTYIDPEMLEILEIPMIYGERSKALSEPNSIVISKEKADKFFPGQNPVGQIVILNENESEPYKIGGVMENLPDNSHLQYDYLLTLFEKEFFPGSQTSWSSNLYDTYLKIKEGTDVSSLEPKLKVIKDTYIISNMEKSNNPRLGEVKNFFDFELQSVKEIYLSNEVSDNLKHGDLRIVRLFGFIAGCILLLACINFINLSTAKSADRAKEVGLRKVVGSSKWSLLRQFIMESMLLSALSFLIALVLLWLLLPYFNLLANKSIAFPGLNGGCFRYRWYL